MRTLVALLSCVVLLVGCATPAKRGPEGPPPSSPTAAGPAPSPSPSPPPTQVPPPPPPAPVVKAPTVEDKRQAQGAALQAATLLDEGKEAEARANLDRALKLDPKNELAKTLLNSITADPEQELGAKFFRYTVKSRDTLSKIAEQYLKDQYKFYLLARYNGIAVPRALQAQQVIKVPGTKPLPPPPPPPPSPSRITQPTQPSTGPTRADESARLEQIQAYDRKARECYRRQDLDCCISSWDKVLQLDPGNEPAERERDRCVRLRDTINSVTTR